MKINRILAIAALFAVATTASAQLSINAGYQNQSHKFTRTFGGNESKSDTTMNGCFIGGSYNVQITGGLGIAPGLYLNYASSSDETTVLGSTAHNQVTDINLKVPVLLNYGLDLNGSMKVFCFAGPVFNYGLTLKDKSWHNDDKDNATSFNLYNLDEDRDDEDNVSRFDLGVALGLGVTYGNYQVYAGYNMGLLDRFNSKNENDNNNITWKSNSLFVGVGMSF